MEKKDLGSNNGVKIWTMFFSLWDLFLGVNYPLIVNTMEQISSQRSRKTNPEKEQCFSKQGFGILDWKIYSEENLLALLLKLFQRIVKIC